jgi:hypothetical protein
MFDFRNRTTLSKMPKILRKLENVAASLTVPERLLLFCIASDTNWQKAGISGETVTVLGVKRLVERDPAGHLSLTSQGRAALGALLEDRWPVPTTTTTRSAVIRTSRPRR